MEQGERRRRRFDEATAANSIEARFGGAGNGFAQQTAFPGI